MIKQPTTEKKIKEKKISEEQLRELKKSKNSIASVVVDKRRSTVQSLPNENK